MNTSALKILSVLIVAGAAAGCSTMTATQKVSAVATPMSAPMMAQAPTPVVQPQGLDFSSAVAMIANTPGSGVTRAGGRAPTQALALVSPTLDSAVNRPAAPRPAPKAAAAPPAPAVAPEPPPRPAPQEAAVIVCDPTAVVATPACPLPKPVVRRF